MKKRILLGLAGMIVILSTATFHCAAAETNPYTDAEMKEAASAVVETELDHTGDSADIKTTAEPDDDEKYCEEEPVKETSTQETEPAETETETAAAESSAADTIGEQPEDRANVKPASENADTVTLSVNGHLQSEENIQKDNGDKAVDTEESVAQADVKVTAYGPAKEITGDESETALEEAVETEETVCRAKTDSVADEKINTWYTSEKGRVFYFDKNGELLKGLQEINGQTYFFDEKTGQRKPAGWVTAKNGRTYYVDKNGIVQTGWQDIGGRKYYLMDERCDGYRNGVRGVLLNGFRVIDGKTRYFYDKRANVYCEAVKSSMAIGFRSINRRLYHFSSSGIMTTGLYKPVGKVYYFSSDGIQKTRLVTVSGRKYYFAQDGAPVTGWKEVSGKKYYISKSSAARGADIIGNRLYYFDENSVLKPEYTRNAQPLIELSKNNRNKAVEFIGKMDEILDKGGKDHQVISETPGITLGDYKKIKKAIDETLYYGRPSYITYAGWCTKDSDVVSGIHIISTVEKFRKYYMENKELEARITKAFNSTGVKNGDSDRQKARKINDYICRTFSYGSARDMSVSIGLLGSLRTNTGVCSDYADYFYWLCKKAGLKCMVVSAVMDDGTSDGLGHAINMVFVNGKWKYNDATWNDAGDHSSDNYFLTDKPWGGFIEPAHRTQD